MRTGSVIVRRVSSPLPSLESGFPLLPKCFQRLRPVCCRQNKIIGRVFTRLTPLPPIDSLHRGFNGNGTAFADDSCHFDSLFKDFPPRHSCPALEFIFRDLYNSVCEADKVRLFSRNTSTCQDEISCSALSNKCRQAVSATGARNDGQSGFWQAYRRGRSNDAEVGAECQLEAAAERGAAYGGNSGYGKGGKASEGGPQGFQEISGARCFMVSQSTSHSASQSVSSGGLGWAPKARHTHPR